MYNSANPSTILVTSLSSVDPILSFLFVTNVDELLTLPLQPLLEFELVNLQPLSISYLAQPTYS